ncbi:MAG: ATP-dependent sacrificial sulfur transferase LarE [Oscillospiraceae bacterium]|nr:ATP-dependent sacrificial sulfur transferase LarE [Oscillospiraceae bacterium]
MELQTFFHAQKKIGLAFSGGTDSAYLLYAAKQAGCTIQAYFIKTVFQPAFELADAKRLATALNVPLTVLELDILQNDYVRKNDSKRCYYCKTALFEKLIAKSKEDGCSVLIDGTNASDDATDRPGMRALKELGVRSPLRECGITKAMVREASRAAGLFTHNKPSYACLATRIATDTALDADTLCRVEQAEKELASMGFSDFRVRVFYGAARIQLPQNQLQKAIENNIQIEQALQPYFTPVLLDLQPRG